jgi:mitogen-activated protein kinase 15
MRIIDAQRTYREVMILQELNGNDNIIEVLNVIEADNDKDLYIVCDYMQSDLSQIIKSRVLQDVHKSYVLYQILKALKYIHSGQLIHRDLKPSNILLNADCHVKLGDFGLARSISPAIVYNQETNPVMTEYVATRWYRAPELVLGSTAYTTGVDVWAVGCILGEMIRGSPLFPGLDTLQQLDKILRVTGRPTSEDIVSIQSRFARQVLAECPISKRMSLQELCPTASPDAIDFMKRCFQFNPNKRPSVAELLEHPLVAQFHNPSQEHDCPVTIGIPLDDNVRLTVKDYRDRIYQEIIKRRQQNSEDDDRPTTPVKPQHSAVPQTTGVVMTEFSQRSCNLTPTTCHTNNGHLTPTTPGTNTLKSLIPRSPSTKSIGGSNPMPQQVPYRMSSVTPAPRPVSRTRSPSASRIIQSTMAVIQPNNRVPAKPLPSGVAPYVRPTSSGLSGSKLLRTPSMNSLLGRSRASSPLIGKRPSTTVNR